MPAMILSIQASPANMGASCEAQTAPQPEAREHHQSQGHRPLEHRLQAGSKAPAPGRRAHARSASVKRSSPIPSDPDDDGRSCAVSQPSAGPGSLPDDEPIAKPHVHAARLEHWQNAVLALLPVPHRARSGV